MITVINQLNVISQVNSFNVVPFHKVNDFCVLDNQTLNLLFFNFIY